MKPEANRKDVEFYSVLHWPNKRLLSKSDQSLHSHKSLKQQNELGFTDLHEFVQQYQWEKTSLNQQQSSFIFWVLSEIQWKAPKWEMWATAKQNSSWTTRAEWNYTAKKLLRTDCEWLNWENRLLSSPVHFSRCKRSTQKAELHSNSA